MGKPELRPAIYPEPGAVIKDEAPSLVKLNAGFRYPSIPLLERSVITVPVPG